MGSLIVRGVPDELIARLKQQAAEHGRSAEAEHRAILQQALGRTNYIPWDFMKDQIWVAPDFDETPDDIIDAMENGNI